MDKQLGFLKRLPNDIVQEIFTYLEQRDCLNCMAVCHAWDATIPLYTQHVWRELRLSTRDIRRNYRRRERCLGSHVQHVILEPVAEQSDEYRLYNLLQKLIDWKCDRIEFLELSSWKITSESTLVGLLTKLSTCMTQLKLTKCQSYILLPHILMACPVLTHFTGECSAFSTSDGADEEGVTTLLSRLVFDSTMEITHLRLDMVIDIRVVKWIVRRCPNLRCFIGDSQDTWVTYGDWGVRSRADIPLDSLFSWCPKIAFYIESQRYYHIKELDNPDDYIIEETPGLRYINVSDSASPASVARLLMKNQNTLEYVSIGIYHGEHNWSSVFGALHMPKLRTLIYRETLGAMPSDTVITGSSLVALLNRCPSLETLSLAFNIRHLALDLPTIQPLETLPRLLRLECDLVYFYEELLITTFLERFPAVEKLIINNLVLPLDPPPPKYTQGPSQLTHLELSSLHWSPYHDYTNDTDVAQLIQYLTGNTTRLEKLKIPNIALLGFESLQTISMISTLKYLEVSIDPKLQDAKFVEFIHVLGRTTAIEDLTLGTIDGLLSDDILDALLKSLPRLQRLVFAEDRRVRACDNETSVQLNRKAFEQVLDRSSKLEFIFFHAVEVQDGTRFLTGKQILELIEKKMPRFKVSHEGWGVFEDGQTLVDVMITKHTKNLTA